MGVSAHQRVLIFLILLGVLFSQNTKALAWTVSPVRFEVKAEKGKEYTLTFSVLNESQLYQKRFEIQTDDWVIDKENNFLRKAFNKNLEIKYSATSWIRVSPQQFVLPPGQSKSVRFTIAVPSNLDGDGEYKTGIFVGEKNIEKPPKGEKIVHIKQDTYIGVIVYVKIGEEKPEIILKDFKVSTKPQEKNLHKVTIYPVYESHGNVHSRGQISVKMEPLSAIGPNLPAPDAFNAGELVVLRGTEVAYPIDIPVLLPANSEWKFVVTSDFGNKTPNLVGTKKYKIPLHP
ncbi:MAG: hypothetical protein HYY52_04280 [Candidatus Melainabacteria bacterium]|nr:hypothetical protein [Candidatus Melainabacteria bacterium]